MAVQFTRTFRPDLVIAFKNALALQNGFSASFICPDKCTITAATNFSSITDQLVVGSHAGTTKASFYLDQVAGEKQIIPPSTQLSLFILANVLVPAYKLLTPALVVLGFCAFVFGLRNAYRSRTLPVTLVVSTSAYVMVASRVFILALVDISSFPGINLLYAMPGHYFLLFGSVLSVLTISSFSLPYQKQIAYPSTK